MSKYKELTTSSAVIEDPALVAKITGKANDWTAVPYFLFPKPASVDASVILMLLPVLVVFILSLWGLIVDRYSSSPGGGGRDDPGRGLSRSRR
jgi:hypothetical protein